MGSAPNHHRRNVTAAALVLAFWVSGCFWARKQDGRPMHADNPPGSWHVVDPGETMAAIAARAGVPLEDLLEINGLEADESVAPGRLIFVLRPEGQLPKSVLEARPPSRPADEPQTFARTFQRWPLAAPRVTSLFGMRDGRTHEGIDLGAPTGTPVLAVESGFVLYAGDAVSGYGNMVVLQHPNELLTVYAHNSVVLVKTGDRISDGQTIARVGQSGRATAPHLHFEIRRGPTALDPIPHLPKLVKTAGRR